MSYLLNLTAGKLVVGLNDKGELASIHHTCSASCTYQQNVDTIHDANTYDGDNPDVLDFFKRSKDDPLYGVLYESDNKRLVVKVRHCIDKLNELFGEEVPNVVQIKDDMLFAFVNNAGLFPELSADEIFNRTVIVSDEDTTVDNNVALLEFQISHNVVTSNLVQCQSYVWYKDKDGKLIHNCIIPKFGNLRYKNEDEVARPLSHTSDVTMVVKLPEYVSEYYTLYKRKGLPESIDPRLMKVITFTVSKNVIVKEGQ